MKIAIFLSGEVRTLSYCFEKNLKKITKIHPDATVDLFYSFWDTSNRSTRINDPWHCVVQTTIMLQPNKQMLDLYFKSFNLNKVLGEVEDSLLMKKIVSESPLRDSFLSSQYYKTYNVVNKFYKEDEDYDLCLRMRPDILINDFPDKNNILEIKNNNTLIVNKNYWYNEPYIGMDCNEMIWITNSKIFKICNSLFLQQEDVSKMIETKKQYGEYVTGTFFKKLLELKKIDNIKTFDFKYRVVR
jgi:hypothetical protein